MLDEWFPTIARIRSVAAECKHDRARTQAGIANQRPAMELVCPICHGARWVRLQEGYDPLNMHAGDEGSRTQACPGCMAGGVYYPDKERETIADQDGVPNENAQRVVDMSRTTWRVPRTPEGRVDMEALYRDSRVLRGLDPNVDARPSAVPGFKTMRQAMATAPERELVGVGADDDRPF